MEFNKKGQTLMISIVTGLFIFIMGFVFLNFVMIDVTEFRINMDCTNSAISDGSKLTCLMGDAVIPYLILTIVSAAGGIVIGRLL